MCASCVVLFFGIVWCVVLVGWNGVESRWLGFRGLWILVLASWGSYYMMRMDSLLFDFALWGTRHYVAWDRLALIAFAPRPTVVILSYETQKFYTLPGTCFFSAQKGLCGSSEKNIVAPVLNSTEGVVGLQQHVHKKSWTGSACWIAEASGKCQGISSVFVGVISPGVAYIGPSICVCNREEGEVHLAWPCPEHLSLVKKLARRKQENGWN